jgi:hypothetical protein
VERTLSALEQQAADAHGLINNLLVKFARLYEPKGQAHEEHLRKMIAKTIQTVEAIISAVPTVCNRNLDRLRAPRRRR